MVFLAHSKKKLVGLKGKQTTHQNHATSVESWQV
jgi:hypothetical protein